MLEASDAEAFVRKVREVEARERVANQFGREVAAAVALVNTAVGLCRELAAEMETVTSDAPGVEMTSAQLDSARGVASSLKAGDNTPVTAADFAIQAIISAALAKWFPDDAFMGEEDASDLRTDGTLRAMTERLSRMPEAEMMSAIDRGVEPIPRGQRYWVLDPIDGTKGFLTGKQYIIGLALIDGESGAPLVAVMGNPRLHPEPSIMASASGAGMRMFMHGDDGAPARPTNYQVRLNGWASAAYGAEPTSAPAPVAGKDYPPWLISRPMTEGSPLPFGPNAKPGDVCCGALVKYWAVASGEYAGFIQYVTKLKTWDHAAGVLCVAESGGLVTDSEGGAVTFSAREVPVEGGVICSAQEAPGQMHATMTGAVSVARDGSAA
jgi:3'-phosphoadenosine 5'-phosphosulfate (PAPS) 3'-phosphatase